MRKLEFLQVVVYPYILVVPNLGVATPLGVAVTSLRGRLEILCTYLFV